MNWRCAVVLGAICASAMVAAPESARAQGFFDFLFGGFHQRNSPSVSSYADPSPSIGRVAPPEMGSESVRQGDGGTGRSVAFCVRLCDGQHFPMEHLANATPVETCRAMCPASKTKVYFGNGINQAVGRDGARYADLDNAFVYRTHLVAGCTCNGKDAFGLAHFDATNDPTLRPGDIVVTKDGYQTFTGRRGQTAAFTAVDPSTLTENLRPVPARTQLSRATVTAPAQPVEAEADDDDEVGTIVPSGGQSPGQQPAMGLRGQPGR